MHETITKLAFAISSHFYCDQVLNFKIMHEIDFVFLENTIISTRNVCVHPVRIAFK